VPARVRKKITVWSKSYVRMLAAALAEQHQGEDPRPLNHRQASSLGSRIMPHATVAPRNIVKEKSVIAEGSVFNEGNKYR
jgi:hypothetical protein